MVLERERGFLLSHDVLLAWFSAGTVVKMGCIEVGRDLPKQAWIPGSSMVLGNPESQSQSCTLCVSSRRSKIKSPTSLCVSGFVISPRRDLAGLRF